MSAVSVTARLPWERAEGKVQPWHRDRLAVVYVRQSAAAQVADHGESTRLQYGLAERAVTLGWAPSRVLVIDEDLGHSASGADARPGFARLVSEVGLDHVGIVLGIEMSRHQGRRAGSGISCWVRHEALRIRAEIEGLRRRAVAAVG